MDLRARIAAEIARHEGMTVRSLSLAAGLSDSALHKFMTGKTKSLTTDNLEKIAEALGVSLGYLWWDSGEDKVSYLFGQIPQDRRDLALRMLEQFADAAEKEPHPRKV